MAEEIYVTFHPSPLVVSKEFAALADAIEHPEIPLRMSVPVIAAGIQRRFVEQGPGWAPWAESYAPYAETHNRGILWQTGELEASVNDLSNYMVAENALFWTGEASPWYWLFHQEGTIKMPSRPFVGADEETENAVVGVFTAWLDTEIGLSGL